MNQLPKSVGAGNPHATFCGNRGRATASGDPVPGVQLPRPTHPTSHHSRDVTFGEDRSRIRFNPGVFARLRSFAFNILKANRTGTLSQDRYRAALGGFDGLLQLVNI